MPKRSNDFQTVVTLIQRAFADKGAKITESAIVGDDAREIDVLIEGTTGPYRISIAVEAKDESRKMDLVKFEAIVGKYFAEGGIKVNKVVVVTRKGYYQKVVKRAKLLGIELLTLDEAKSKDWQGFVRKSSARYQVAPHLCKIEFEPPVLMTSREDLVSSKLFCAKGGYHGSPLQFGVDYILKKYIPAHEDRFRQSVQDCCKMYGEGHIVVTYPCSGWTLRFGQKSYPLTAIRFLIHVADCDKAIAETCYELKSNDRPSEFIRHLRADFGRHEISMVLPSLSRKRVAIRFSSKQPNKDTNKKRKK